MVTMATVDLDLDNLPEVPNPDLSPTDLVNAVCLGLQHNDHPSPDAGIVRLYHFMAPQGRVSLAPPPPKAGLQGFVDLDFFLENAAGATLGALVLCTDFKLVGEATLTPGTQTRGAFATQQVEVINDEEAAAASVEEEDPEIELLTALVKAPDDFLERVLESQRRGRTPPAPPLLKRQISLIPTRSRMVFKMAQERRPPLAGCWVLQEIFSLSKTKLQILNEGGEEFEGADTG